MSMDRLHYISRRSTATLILHLRCLWRVHVPTGEGSATGGAMGHIGMPFPGGMFVPFPVAADT